MSQYSEIWNEYYHPKLHTIYLSVVKTHVFGLIGNELETTKAKSSPNSYREKNKLQNAENNME